MSPKHDLTTPKEEKIQRLATANRKRPTPAEKKLWRYLRDRRLGGHKFRRQHRVYHYIVDFVCLEKRLIIELDGSQHAAPRNASDDETRRAVLEKRGFTVLRYWNRDIVENIEGTLARISSLLNDSLEQG